jgi:hypothetical protein
MRGAGYIATKPLPNISPEQTRDARARAWIYVFERWQAKKGDPLDLTNSPTMEIETNGPQTTEREKT